MNTAPSIIMFCRSVVIAGCIKFVLILNCVVCLIVGNAGNRFSSSCTSTSSGGGGVFLRDCAIPTLIKVWPLSSAVSTCIRMSC